MNEFTTAQAAEIIGIKEQSLINRINTGRTPARKVGQGYGSTYFLTAEAVEFERQRIAETLRNGGSPHATTRGTGIIITTKRKKTAGELPISDARLRRQDAYLKAIRAADRPVMRALRMDLEEERTLLAL